jgi:hypothetical protein
LESIEDHARTHLWKAKAILEGIQIQSIALILIIQEERSSGISWKRCILQRWWHAIRFGSLDGSVLWGRKMSGTHRTVIRLRPPETAGAESHDEKERACL